MNKITILLDLDGTLKTTTKEKEIICDEKDLLEVNVGANKFRFKPRPHCIELCQYLNDNCILKISTASGRNYARKVVDVLGIGEYISEIISVEKFQSGVQVRGKYIIIDDDDELLDIKLSKIRGGECIGKWKISTYYGDEDDSELLDVIAEVKNIIV